MRVEKHARARCLRVSDRNNVRRKRVRRKARVDENLFFALTTIESDDDEEVNTVDSGAAKSVCPTRKKGVERPKSKKAVKLAAANGSHIRVERDARLEFIRDGMKCSMSFLDADVKRPLASVSSIAEHAGVLLKRVEIGRDGKTAYERLKGKSAKVQGMAFAEGFLWKRKRAGGPLEKLTCMWEDGIYLGVKARTAEIIVENRNTVCG